VNVLRRRGFWVLLLATGLSSFGDELALVALTIRVAKLTKSPLAVSALLIVGLAPLVIFAPLAGLVADRADRARLLAVSTVVQAGLAAGLAYAHTLPAILVLAFALGVGFAFAQPATFALVPAIVGLERVTEANAYLETARYGGSVLGPLFAGSIAAGLNVKAALLFDALSFLVISGAALSLRVGVPSRGQVGSAAERKERARAGFLFIQRDRLLLLITATVGTLALFVAPITVAEVFLATDWLHAGDLGFGILATCWMVGMVFGATVVARRLPPRDLALGVLLGALCGGLAIALAAVWRSFPLAATAFALGGVANGVVNVAARSLMHHRVEDRLRGRVFSAYSALIVGTQLGATALGGIVVDALHARGTFLTGGAGAALVGLAGLALYSRLPQESRRTALSGECESA
jgi:MFS family permease